MTKVDKILYILSMIFVGLACLGGGVALAGFFFEGSIIQLIGVIMLLVFYISSLVLDFILIRRKNDREND